MLSISSIIRESHATAIKKGWWENPDRNFPEQLMLMVTELAEALEAYRESGLDRLLYTDAGKPEGIAAEFADLVIRLADTCGRYDIPLEKALRQKLAYNKTRPYRHGGKLA